MRKFSIAFMLLLILWTAAGCAGEGTARGAQPQQVPEEARDHVVTMLEALAEGDYDMLRGGILGTPDLGLGRQPEDTMAKLVWEALADSFSWKLAGDYQLTETGVAVDVQLHWLNPDSLVRNLPDRAAELLRQKVAQAENVSEIYNEDNEYREELVAQVVETVVREALEQDGEMCSRIVTLNLRCENERWLIEPETDLSGVMDRFEAWINDHLNAARDAAVSVEKKFWLRDEDLTAPIPDPAKAGVASDPAALEWLLEEAQTILQGQETLFSTDLEIYRRSEIHYYLDETIFSVTWREIRSNCVYTISEIKIADPSQLRRYVADGEYGSENQYFASQMAHTVNAVTASAGDYYMYRPYGISVYEGEVMRWDNSVETCYITDTGDLVFSRIGELESWEEAQKFVDDNHIRFSVSFGPILVDNYENVVPEEYKLGEVDGNYSRGAIAILDDLHYLLVVANQGDDGWNSWKPTMIMFAEQVHSMGVKKAYALDGGQTCVIIANDKRISLPDYGRERVMSDILYFATAVPAGTVPES